MNMFMENIIIFIKKKSCGHFQQGDKYATQHGQNLLFLLLNSWVCESAMNIFVAYGSLEGTHTHETLAISAVNIFLSSLCIKYYLSVHVLDY